MSDDPREKYQPMTVSGTLLVQYEIVAQTDDGKRMALNKIVRDIQNAGGSCPLPVYRCRIAKVSEP